MNALTPQQKKAGWIIIGIVVLVHFAPSIINRVREEFGHSTAPAMQSKPSPIRVTPTPQPAPPPLTASQLDEAQMAKLLGVWTGSTVQLDRGSCKMRLELQMKPEEPGRYSGYSTRVCGPSLPFMNGRVTVPRMQSSVVNQLTTVSDILSGTAANGSITLNLDQSIGKSPDGCQLTGFTLTPFGQSQLVAKWTEDKCPGGQMVMGRAR